MKLKSNSKVYRTVIFSLAVVLSFLSFSEQNAFAWEYPLRIYDEFDGITPGQKWGIFQDHNCVLWFYGEEGACSYDGSRFQPFTSSSGLPDNYVYSIAESQDGYIYFGTFRGLARYNAKTGIIEPVSYSQPGPTRDIVFTDLGQFVAHDYGISLLLENKEYLISLINPDAQKVESTLVNDLAWDSAENRLWIVTESYGILLLDLTKLELQISQQSLKKDGKTSSATNKSDTVSDVENSTTIPLSISFEKENEESPLLKHVFGIPEKDLTYNDKISLDKNGHVSIFVNGISYYYNKYSFEKSVTKIPSSLLSTSRLSYQMDGSKHIYSNDKMYVYRNNTLEPIKINRNTVAGSKIISSKIDKNGYLWITWENGSIGKIILDKVKIYTSSEFPELNGITESVIDDNNNLWIASRNGLLKWRDGKLHTVKSGRNFPNDIFSLIIDKKSNLLMQAKSRIYSYDINKNSLIPLTQRFEPRNDFSPVKTDDGNIWFISHDSLFVWDGVNLKNSNLEFRHSTYLGAGPDTSLFLGTWHGLAQLKGKGCLFYEKTGIRYASNFAERNWLYKKHFPKDYIQDDLAVLCGKQNSDGKWWFGCFSGSVFSVDGDSLTILNQNQGLPSQRVSKVFEDPKKQLFFMTSGGFIVPEANKTVLYDSNLSSTAQLVDYSCDEHGREYFATSRGLYIKQSDFLQSVLDYYSGIEDDNIKAFHSISPSEGISVHSNSLIFYDVENLINGFSHPDSVLITTLVADSIRMSLEKELRLPLGQRSFRVEFTLTDYFNEPQNRFEWKLEGYDNEFKKGTVHEASYEKVPPGSYYFVVHAWDSAGKKVSASTIKIHVPAYTYETTAFWVLLSILGLFLLGTIIYLRFLQLEKRRLHLEQIVKEKTAEAISHYERANKAEIEAQQRAVVNKLAAAIAHEFNNPLAIIKGTSDLYMEGILTESEDLQKGFNRIDRQIIRMADLVNKLLGLKEIHEMDYADGFKILDLHHSAPPPELHSQKENKKH